MRSRCCASPRTRATASPAFASRNCCRASARRARKKSSPRRRRDDGFASAAAPIVAAGQGARGLRRIRRRCCSASPAARPGRAISARRSRGGARISRRRYDNVVSRAADLDALERIAATYPSRERFLSELTLDPPDATSDEAGPPLRDEDYLILSTIHSAKGQEWKSVFVLNCVDGCIPSDLATGSSDEIEEERRLLYVAMTRAKDELALIVPQRFYVHGQPKTATAMSGQPHALHPGAAAETL